MFIEINLNNITQILLKYTYIHIYIKYKRLKITSFIFVNKRINIKILIII